MREVLFSGFGTYDTHAGPSNLRYGFDNRIWGTVGYSGFEGVVGEDSVRLYQSVYRFTPSADHLELVSTFTNNMWGLGFSEAFDVFGSTANNEHSVHVAIFDRYYRGVPGLRGNGKVKLDGHYAMRAVTPNIRQVDVLGGFTAAAGHSLYTARDFPPEYWNRVAFVSEPTGHLVHQAIIEPEGSGFREQDGWNLLASSDEWVSPVQAEVGPDGAVWVLDWYNFIVQHNPTPAGFSTGAGNAHINVLRDKAHGRIYRISYDGAAPTPFPALNTPRDLIRALGHSNLFWRLAAQRNLVERNLVETAQDLVRLVQSRDTDADGLKTGAIHALWTLHGLGLLVTNAPARTAAYGALRHAAPSVRKTALAVLPHDADAAAAIVEAGALSDPDAGVRLAAYLAVSEMPPSMEVGRILYAESLRNHVLDDVWLPEALYIAAHQHQVGFLDAAGPGGLEESDAKAQAADWSAFSLDDSDWQVMDLPGMWRATDDLRSFDGVIWFRRTLTLPHDPTPMMLDLGGIYDSDVTYVNGAVVGASREAYAEKRRYRVPAAVLREQRNVIAVRVEDPFGNGGFSGTADEMALRSGTGTVALSGPWRYKIEAVYPGGKKPDLSREVPLAAQLARHVAASAEDVPRGEAVDQEVTLSVLPGLLRFDQPSFTVTTRSTVALTFTNPGEMPHNAVFIKPGSTEAVGRAADQLEGADYVPAMDAVLFATPMVPAKGAVTIRFTAPAEEGSYPYLCTFPGHWRLMQGTMVVRGR